MSEICDKCNGLFTDQSACNSFKNNSVFKAKYIAVANAALTVAEAIDVYVGDLNNELAIGSRTLGNLTSQTMNILTKLTGLFPCIHLRQSASGAPVQSWFSNFDLQTEGQVATGLFLLTPPCPCGLGTFKIHCCPLLVSENYSDSEAIGQVPLSGDLIEKWCCTGQHLRAIASFLKDYFC